MYKFSAPGMNKSEISRTTIEFTARPAHETLQNEYEETGFETRLRETITENMLPPSYYDHPVVETNPEELVVPVGLYMDGLPYSLVDSVLGVWFINMVTGMRHV